MIWANCQFPQLLFFWLLLTCHTEAVKEYLFKKCDQSPFCHRNRHYSRAVGELGAAFESPYSVDRDSIQFDLIQSSFKGHLLKKLNDDSSVVVLPFQLDIIEDGNVRFQLDELARLSDNGPVVVDNDRLTKRRYNEAFKHSLKDKGSQIRPLSPDVELKFDKLDSHIQIDYGADLEYHLALHYSPFKLTLSHENTQLLLLNEANLLNFEHWRPHIDNDTVNVSPYESDFNMFEDTFKDSKKDKMPFGPESVLVDVSFHEMTHLYGLSEHASQQLALKDTKNSGIDPYRLYNVDIFEYEDESQFPMYGSVPFIMGVGPQYSAGVFWINAADTYIDLDLNVDTLLDQQAQAQAQQAQQPFSRKTKPLSSHWISENGIIDLILLVGRSPAEINAKYGRLVGNLPLPPLFSLGNHQCRWNYNDQLDVLDIHAKFDAHNISYDTIWLDIEYTDAKKYFTWKHDSFPDPMAMLRELDTTSRNLVAIIDPHIKTGYHVSEHLQAHHLAVQNSDNGDSYHGHCWPGESVWIDTFNPLLQQYWATLYANSSDNEFLGESTNMHLWNDMNEPSVFNGPETSMPKDLVHFGGWEHRSVHNLYGLTFHEATFEALLQRNPNKRPFVLTRSFFAGSQRTSAMWTGDNMSKWAYLKLSIPMNMNQGLVNYIFSGSDVGGFFGDTSKELLTRWYQTGIWYPFFRAHAHIDSRRREPWIAGGEYTEVMRNTVDLRYKLLPVIYTEFFRHSLTGGPFMKPMFYDFPGSLKLHLVNDQFFIGDAGLLVKPITDENCQQSSVYFPDDSLYYDFYTHELVSSKLQEYTIKDVQLSTLPVYYKGGSVLATRERHRRSSRLQRFDPYTLTVVLNSTQQASGRLYIDDGESYNYEKGEYALVQFEFSKNVLTAHVETGTETWSDSWIEKLTFDQIIVIGANGKKKNAKIVQEDSERDVSVLENGADLIIRTPGLKVIKSWKVTI